MLNKCDLKELRQLRHSDPCESCGGTGRGSTPAVQGAAMSATCLDCLGTGSALLQHLIDSKSYTPVSDATRPDPGSTPAEACDSCFLSTRRAGMALADPGIDD